MVKKSNVFGLELAAALLGIAGCSGGYQEKVIDRLLDYSEQSRQDSSIRVQLVALGMSPAESINTVAAAEPRLKKDAKANLLKLCPDADQEAGELRCEPAAAKWIRGFQGLERKIGPQGKVLIQDLRINTGGEDVDGVAAVAIDGKGHRQRVVQFLANGVISKGLPYGKKSLAEVLPKKLSAAQAAQLRAGAGQAIDSPVCPFGNAAVAVEKFEQFNRQVLQVLLQKEGPAWLEAKPGKDCVRVDVQTPKDLRLSQRWQKWVAEQTTDAPENLSTDDTQVYLVADSTEDGQRERIEKLEGEKKDLQNRNQDLAGENQDLTRENQEQSEGRRTANARVFELERQQRQQRANQQQEVRNNRRHGRRNSTLVVPVGRRPQPANVGGQPQRPPRRNSMNAMGRGGLGISPQGLRLLQLEAGLRESRKEHEQRLAEVKSARDRNRELTDELDRARRFVSVITREARNLENLRAATGDSLRSANEQIVKYKRSLDEKEKAMKEKEIEKSLYQIAALIADVKKKGSSKVRKVVMDRADKFARLQDKQLKDLVKELIEASKYNFGENAKNAKGEIGRVLVFLAQSLGEIEFLNENQRKTMYEVIPEELLQRPQNRWLDEQLVPSFDVSDNSIL